MRANKGRDTVPELLLRSALHRRGHRYRVHMPITTAKRPVRPDIVFSRARIAVFVDGCFWHGCPDHGQTPARNRQFWVDKLRATAARDVLQTDLLEIEGWTVLRFWEHEPVESAIRTIEKALG